MNYKHVCGSVLVFMLWMGFTFSCHWCTKSFLDEMLKNDSHSMINNIILAMTVTISQAITCWILLDIKLSQGNENTLKNIWILTHVLANLTTNISFSLMRASSTVTIKLLEPILSACLTKYITQTTQITATTYISLLTLCAGAITFVGNPFQNLHIGLGVILALISNLLFGLRNIVKKHGIENAEINFFDYIHYFIVITVFAATGFFNSTNRLPLLFLLGSSASHVIYSYVSMFIVLKYMGVITHAIANIFKRMSVIICLAFLTNEELSLSQFGSLLICAVGLAMYNRQRIKGSKSGKLKSDLYLPQFNFLEKFNMFKHICQNLYLTCKVDLSIDKAL